MSIMNYSKKSYLIFIFVLICLFLAAGCGRGDKEAMKHIQQAERLKDRERYKEAIDEYRLIINKYPKSKYVKRAKKSIEDTKIAKDVKEQLTRAGNSINQQDYETAIEQLEAIIKQYPDSSHSKIAEESIAVAKVLRQAQKMYQEGRELQKSKQYGGAIAIYNKIIEQFDPDNIFVKNAKESIAASRQEKERFDKLSAKLREKQLRDARLAAAENLFKKAENFYSREEFIKAKEAYQKLVKTYPDSPWYNKAKNQIEHSETSQIDKEAKTILDTAASLMEEGNYQEAIQTYQKVLDNYKTSLWHKAAQQKISNARDAYSKVEYEKALALEEAGKREEAIEAYYSLFQSMPTTDSGKRAHQRRKILEAKMGAEKLFDQAEKYYGKGKYDAAIDACRKIAEDFPNSKLLNKAKDMIRNSEAGRLYKTAMTKKEANQLPAMVLILEEITTSYQKTPWYDKAKGDINRYEENKSEKMYNEAMAALEKDNFDEADNILKELIKETNIDNWKTLAEDGLNQVHNKRIEKRYNVAEDLYKEGKFRAALIEYQNIKRDYPNTNWAELSEKGISKANTSLASGLLNQAVSLYEKEGAAKLKKVIDTLSSIQKKYPLTSAAKKAGEQITEIQGKNALQEITTFLEKKEYLAVVDIYNKLKGEQPGSDWLKSAKQKLSDNLADIYSGTIGLAKDPMFAPYTKKVFQLIVDEFPESEFAKKSAERL